MLLLVAIVTILIVALYAIKSQQRRTSAAASDTLLLCRPSDFHHHIKKECKALQSRYSPPWYARSAHLQIVLTFLIPQKPQEYQSEMVKLSDGGITRIDWAINESSATWSESRPILVVLHGLTGCSQALRTFCSDAITAGYRPVVFNKRGHGGTTLHTAKLQPFGDVTDFTLALSVISNRYPKAVLVGAGFSAGSGLLVSYLGHAGKDSVLSAAVGISPGYDAKKLFGSGDGISPLYNWLMTFSVKSLVSSHATALADVVDFDALRAAKSLEAVDEATFMKFAGVEDMDEYWRKNNPMRDVHSISVPILCINALDDPVCTKGMIPYDLFKEHKYAMLAATDRGSHCAFYQGKSILQLKSWAHDAALEYLSAALAFKQ